MIMPIYQDEYTTVYCDENQNVTPHIGTVDHVFTDPPYGTSTHDGALMLRTLGTTGESGWERASNPTTKRRRDVDRKLTAFDSISYADLQSIIAGLAPQVQRWFVSFMERRYIEPLEQWCEVGEVDEQGILRPGPFNFIREGIYYKPNGMPQVSGDRPAQGWESIAIMHRKANGRLRWNGGGHDAVYIENKPSTPRHPTQKPLALAMKMIGQFTDPGDTILDPFAGSGVFGVACKKLRRHCILIERDPSYAAGIVRWLKETQPMMADLIMPPLARTEAML